MSQPAPTTTDVDLTDRMSVTFVGHVDHGKSTVIGRLLADTDSLPEGKIDAIKASCKRAGKPFEYAFLLDALKDEQAQGITIDSARCFFRGAEREYVLIDAPGHIEFLKNMVSGAARAEAALLVIDAREGVQENSRRHATLLRMLGIPTVTVLVNKMDLVDYDEKRFEAIVDEYRAFLAQIGVEAVHYIPVSALEGDNIAVFSGRMPWYEGPTALEALDGLPRKSSGNDGPLRLPVQDVYKFAAEGDERRLVAGQVTSGALNVGDAVVFTPSGKRSTVASIETFAAPEKTEAESGESVAITLSEQIYVRRGEVMSHVDSVPEAATEIRASLFWMARQPLRRGVTYKLKIGTAEAHCELVSIDRVVNASDLGSDRTAEVVKRHEVGECVLRLKRAVAIDIADVVVQTGRFVLVDGYEIAGGGLVLEVVEDDLAALRRAAETRDTNWIRSELAPQVRADRHGHKPALVIVTGRRGAGRKTLARELEQRWFRDGRFAYFVAIGSVVHGVDIDIGRSPENADEHLRRLGEIAHLMLGAGMVLVSSAQNLGAREFSILKTLIAPNPVVTVGIDSIEQCDVDLESGYDLDDAAERVGRALGDAGVW